MRGVFGIRGGRSKDICTCICGAASTILAATRETVAEGSEVEKDRAS